MIIAITALSVELKWIVAFIFLGVFDVSIFISESQCTSTTTTSSTLNT